MHFPTQFVAWVSQKVAKDNGLNIRIMMNVNINIQYGFIISVHVDTILYCLNVSHAAIVFLFYCFRVRSHCEICVVPFLLLRSSFYLKYRVSCQRYLCLSSSYWYSCLIYSSCILVKCIYLYISKCHIFAWFRYTYIIHVYIIYILYIWYVLNMTI